MKKIVLLLTTSLLATPAYAEVDIVAPTAKSLSRIIGQQHCGQENVSLSITFNIKAKSFTDAKAKFDEKMKQIESYAKQQHIESFEPQSLNYNINPQQISYEDGAPVIGGYQLSGNASYKLASADAAFKLGESLATQKIQASINVNQYNNPACANQTAN